MKKIFKVLSLSIISGTLFGGNTAFVTTDNNMSIVFPVNYVDSSGFAYSGIDKHKNNIQGTCSLSAYDCSLLLKAATTSNHFYNWITSYNGGGCSHGPTFRHAFVNRDLNSIQELINGVNTHVYYHGDFGKFNFN